MRQIRSSTLAVAALTAVLCGVAHADERLYLPIDPDAESAFKRLEELGARGQWDRVVAGLDRLLNEGGDRLLEGPEGYRSVRAEARRRLLALEGEGRVAYDLVHAQEAKRLFELGLQRSGTAEFAELLAEHPASDPARRVRSLLIGRLIEQGNPAAALPHVAVLLEGRLEPEERSRLRRLQVLVLAQTGRRGAATNALEALAQDDPEAASALRPRIEALRPPATQPLQDPGALAWSQEVFGYYEILPQGSRPWSLPAVDAAIAYTHDGSHAIATDLSTGKLVWRTALGEGDAFQRPEGKCPLALGQGVVLCALPRERGLVALDRLSGRVLWRRDLEQLKTEAKVDFNGHLATSAPPQISGGVAAVPLVTDHQDREVHLLGVDLFTGSLAWSVFVASEAAADTPHPALTQEDGRFLITTGNGAVAAVDAAGEVLWLRTYPSTRDDKRRPGRGRRVFPFRGRGVPKQNTAPPTREPTLLASRGLVWSSPADGKGLEAYDLLSGERRAQIDLKSARLLAEHDGGVLALTKEGELHLVKRAGTKALAKVPGAIDLAPALIGERLYLATGQGVLAVDLSTKAVQPVSPWTASKGAGNLAAAGGRLLVAAPRGLYAYGQRATAPADLVGNGPFEPLVEALGAPSYSTRERAEEALMARGDDARAPLQTARAHHDPEVALRASVLLGELQRADLLARWKPLVKPEWTEIVPDLLNRLSHPNPQQRLEVLSAMGSIDDADALALMRDLLGDENPRVAFVAAAALLEKGDRSGAAHMARMLSEGKSPLDRLQAAQKLTQHGAPEDYDALCKGLTDEDVEVRAAVIPGVFKLGRERCLPLLPALFKDENTAVRLAAINNLVAAIKTRKPDEEQAKLQFLPDPSPVMNLWALGVVDENDLIRETAARQLARVRSPRAYELLSLALGDKKRTTVRLAAKALIKIATTDAVLHVRAEELEKGSQNPDLHIKNYIAQIAVFYAEAGGTLSVPTLARFMGAGHYKIRGHRVQPGNTGWPELLHQRLQTTPADAADAEALAELILFTDEDHPDDARDVRFKAYQVIRDAVSLPGKGRLLAQGLADAEAAVRVGVTKWIQEKPVPAETLAEALRISLRAKREEAKASAARLLEKLPADRLFPALLPILTEPDAGEELQQAARARLAAASEGKLSFAEDSAPQASHAPFAVWWWQQKHPGLTPELLLEQIADANPTKRYQAAQLAAGLPLPRVRDALIRSLASEGALWVLKEKLKALVAITGEQHGFDEKGKLPELRACAQRFEAWLEARGGE